VPIYSRRNLYPGVNAHLNSFLQTSGNWAIFHSPYSVGISRALDQAMPRQYFGYVTRTFQSGDSTFDDVGEPMIMAIAVYEFELGVVFGQLAAWIELILPDTKLSPLNLHQYKIRRSELLQTGVTVVEVDYLSEAPSLFVDKTDTTYSISVTHAGTTTIYPFGVIDPIPQINIPLLQNDVITFDLAAIYNETFLSLRVFTQLVDYAQDPVNFDRYTPADQAKIHALLDEIRHTNPKTSE